MKKELICFLFLILFLIPGISAATYWISPTGTAAWTNCQSETPLSGTVCCSLSTANSNVQPGDTVMLRGGTYTTNIRPARSGTANNRIVYQAYLNEIPTLTITSYERAILLQNRSYVTIDGISSIGSDGFFFIGLGSSYNEIKNSVFDTSSTWYSVGIICQYNTAYSAYAPSTHNWIHNNTFLRYGYISSACNDMGTVRIGAHRTDESSYNTFENNVFFYGGHDNIDIGGQYNVVRNNIFNNDEAYFAVPENKSECRNDPPSGYFGNRNIILTNYGNGPGTAFRTLIEGNRLGHAGSPPDDDGQNGIENAGAHTVARYNYIYNAGGVGYYSKMQGVYDSSYRSGSWARVYHNTIYHSGYGSANIYGDQFKWGVCIWSYRTYDDWPENVAVINNIVKNSIVINGVEKEWRTGTQNILPQVRYENNWGKNDANLDFVNPDLSDRTSYVLPDLRIKSNSPVIDAGIPLTSTTNSGTNSITLIVDDALFFQDGTWGSALTHGITHFPDWIAIGSVDNVVEIASINYATNTITLASPKTWNNNAPIWLYKKSDGTRVLYGNAPDIGAHQYISGEIIPDPILPTPDIVTVQDMLSAYQQYKRNEVSLIYFLDKLRRWIVFW